MGKIYLLDCTLRDGGYINDWNFGEDSIKGFGKKIAQTGVEIYEVGFMKGDCYDPDKAVFPDIETIAHVIQPKADHMLYVVMVDMGSPVPLERIAPCNGSSVDGIRIIFKKEKIKEAYDYCKKIQELGYITFVNFVGTDMYTDSEFAEGIKLFNQLNPFAISIVDSFGMIKRKQFLHFVQIADDNMAEGIALAYHAHNNLQQAFGNAEAFVELKLKRDIVIDACVFGMGRGAGNLNLELFAEYMNENYDTHYKIDPMLEIMDEYLNDIYKTKFWGYSLPLYISATTGCHPNYAIYLAEKDTLTVKSFHELLSSIPQEEKARFTREKAEKFYREYQENYIDDKKAIVQLTSEFAGKTIVLLAPGRTLLDYKEDVIEKLNQDNVISIAVNFCALDFHPDYLFSSNMRRFVNMQGKTDAKCITTSNMKDCEHTDYVVNFASFSAKNPDIIDNSGLMLLKLLMAVGVKEVSIAGMDGYSAHQQHDYFDQQLEHDFSQEAANRNSLISDELREIEKNIKLNFITPTIYKI